jgi:hypothetical protein
MTDNKMNTYGMTVDMSNFSGWSDAACVTCRRRTTKAQTSYSLRFYGKPLCRSCQKLEDYEAK